MAELIVNQDLPAPLVTHQELMLVVDDITRLSAQGNGSAEMALLRKHDYASVAQRFADKLRREAAERAA